MFRFFNMFGRSAALNALDETLRAFGLHPLLVPDAVKLTIIQLHKREGIAKAGTGEAEYGGAAELLAYCVLGQDTFTECNGVRAADMIEHRVEAATAAGDSYDAKLILLALHAGLMAPDIADRFDVEDR